MPDTINYKLHEIPLLARNLASSRTPRLQPSVPEEYGSFLSNEISRGEWTYDPENGEPLSAKGQTLSEHLEFTLKTRPHWLMPVEKGGDDEADAAWLEGNMTRRSARLTQLEKFCGSKAAALVMLHEEAARYGVTKPFTQQIGVKPGTKSAEEKKPGENLSTNPWSASWRGDEEQRMEKITSIIKTGSAMAIALSKAAGTVVSRPLRKPVRK